MKFKKPLLIFLTILAISTICFGSYLFWEGYYLPNKPCRPIAYPTARRLDLKIGETSRILTNNRSEDVIAFFDQNLDVTVIPQTEFFDFTASRIWLKKQISADVSVYQCIAEDLNNITFEQGCIYVKKTTTGTLIETVLWGFDDMITVNWTCDDPTQPSGILTK